MKRTIINVKTWIKGGPGHGFYDDQGKPIDIPDIKWDQIEEIRLEGIKSVEMDFSGPYIAGLETCVIDEGEYKDMHSLVIGSMICKPLKEKTSPYRKKSILGF